MPDEETPPAGGRGGAQELTDAEAISREAPKGHARAVRTRRDKSSSGEEFVAANVPPIISPGRYEAVATSFSIFRVFGEWKVAVWWDVLVADGEHGHRRVRLPSYYNVRREGGRIIPAAHGRYLREWMVVAGRRPSRGDRVQPRAFLGVLCSVDVRVVTADAEQRKFAECVRYSVVARVLERLAGGSWL